MNKQIITAIKEAKDVKELNNLAKKHGYNLTSQEVDNYFALFHKQGKVNETELEHVTGGACYSTDPHGKLIVVPGFNSCDGFEFALLHDKNDHDCGNCKYLEDGPGPTYYCSLRTRYKDDFKK